MRATVSMVLAAVLLAAALLAESHTGRQAVVAAERAGCERQSDDLALVVNHIRIDEQADAVVAQSRGVPARVRQTRRVEVRAQDKAILVLDTHIDRRAWWALGSRADQLAVRYGVGGRRPFRCRAAFPSGPFLKFW